MEQLHHHALRTAPVVAIGAEQLGEIARLEPASQPVLNRHRLTERIAHRVELEPAPDAGLAALAFRQLQQCSRAPRAGPALEVFCHGLVRARLRAGSDRTRASSSFTRSSRSSSRVKQLGSIVFGGGLVAAGDFTLRHHAHLVCKRATNCYEGKLLEPVHGSVLRHLGPRKKVEEASQKASAVLESTRSCGACSRAPSGATVPRAAAGLRQPQPAHVERRAGRLRHGLHAGHLPPCARIEQLSFEMTVEKLVSAFGYPETLRTLALRPRLRDARAVRRQGATATCSRSIASARGPRLPRPPAAHRRRARPQLYRNERIRLKNPRVRVDRHALRAARGVPVRRHRSSCSRRSGADARLRQAVRRHPRGDRHGAPRQLAQGGDPQGPRPATSSRTRSWAPRCTSCARAARSCSCSPTRCGTTPTR